MKKILTILVMIILSPLAITLFLLNHLLTESLLDFYDWWKECLQKKIK